MKAQPPLWISPLSNRVETLSSESVAVEPQTTKATVSPAVTPKTTRSVVGRRPWCGTSGRSAVTGRYSPRPPVPCSSCDTNGTFHAVRNFALRRQYHTRCASRGINKL